MLLKHFKKRGGITMARKKGHTLYEVHDLRTELANKLNARVAFEYDVWTNSEDFEQELYNTVDMSILDNLEQTSVNGEVFYIGEYGVSLEEFSQDIVDKFEGIEDTALLDIALKITYVIADSLMDSRNLYVGPILGFREECFRETTKFIDLQKKGRIEIGEVISEITYLRSDKSELVSSQEGYALAIQAGCLKKELDKIAKSLKNERYLEAAVKSNKI